MSENRTSQVNGDVAAYRAVELIYHSYLTGLILMISYRAGAARAADAVFRTFRRQQLARFVPGLKKLGLDGLPHAVACAQYHYLSNRVRGVKVEYVYESDDNSRAEASGNDLAGRAAAEGSAQLCDGIHHLDRAENDRGSWP